MIDALGSGTEQFSSPLPNPKARYTYNFLSRVFVLDKVTDFLLLLGKLVVVGAVGVLSFYFFSGEWWRRNNQIKRSPLSPINWIFSVRLIGRSTD